MKCPVCNTVDLVMSDRQGVEIDYCPQCRGVWLDRGELDKILERASTPAPSAAPPVYQDRQPSYRPDEYRKSDDYRKQEHYPHHKRKKNWLEEIFD